MRVVENTPSRLVLRDRSHLAAMLVMGIAVIFAVLGFGGLAGAEDATERLVFGLFGVGSIPIALGALFIVRTHTHAFDRQAGVIDRRVTRLLGRNEHARIPLGHIRRAVVETDHDHDGDTHRVVLILDDGARETMLPLRDYYSSSAQQGTADAINRWLGSR